MIPWILDINPEWLIRVLVNLFIKSTLITVLVLLICRFFKKERPSLQYSIWKAYCLILFVLPFFSVDILQKQNTQTAALEIVKSLPVPYNTPDFDLAVSMEEIIPAPKSLNSLGLILDTSLERLTETLGDFLLILFPIGVFFFLLLALVELIVVLYISHQKKIETTGYWDQKLNYFRDKLGLSRSVRLIFSSYLKVPFTFGWWRPIIFVPEKWINCPESEIDTVLIHELCHIQRNDFIFNVLLQFHKCLYWWNPLVWVAAKKMQLACEQSCDELVIRNGVSPIEYASQLLNIVKNMYRKSHTMPTFRLSMIKKSELEERVRMLISPTMISRSDKPVVLTMKYWGLLVFILPILLYNYEPGTSDSNIWNEAEIYGKLSGSNVYAKVISLKLLGQQEQINRLGLPIIIESLDDQDPNVRASAAWALGQFDEEMAVDALVPLLNDESDIVREKALLSLGEIGEIDAFYPITYTHQNNNPEVRKASLWALYKMGCIPAFNLVAQHLNDEDPEVRNLSQQLIKNFDSEKMVTWLLDVDMDEHRNYVYLHFSEVKEQGLMNSLVNRIGENQNLEIELRQTINKVTDKYVIDHIQNILRNEVKS